MYDFGVTSRRADNLRAAALMLHAAGIHWEAYCDSAIMQGDGKPGGIMNTVIARGYGSLHVKGKNVYQSTEVGKIHGMTYDRGFFDLDAIGGLAQLGNLLSSSGEPKKWDLHDTAGQRTRIATANRQKQQIEVNDNTVAPLSMLKEMVAALEG